MTKNVPLRSMPLRDLVNQLEHRIRELHEHLSLDMSKAAEEMHQLSRPKRRKSAYPTIRNVSNGYEQFSHSVRYASKLAEGIDDGLAVLESRLDEVA
jgi:hypothetical protein